MESESMKDKDKLIVIAQTYSLLKGSFTAKQLYTFIQSYKFRFHSDFTTRQIGKQLTQSRKFNTLKDENPVKYEVI